MPPGDYRLEGEAGPDLEYPLVIEGLRNCVIQGAPGARLVAAQVGGVVLMRHCRNVRLVDLELDLDPPAFVQGRITAVDEKTPSLEIELDKGQPRLDQPPFTWLERGVQISVRDERTNGPLTPHGALSAPVPTAADHPRYRFEVTLGGAYRQAGVMDPAVVKVGARVPAHPQRPPSQMRAVDRPL